MKKILFLYLFLYTGRVVFTISGSHVAIILISCNHPKRTLKSGCMSDGVGVQQVIQVGISENTCMSFFQAIVLPCQENHDHASDA